MKHLLFMLILGIVFLFVYNKIVYNKKLIKIKIATSILDCEQDNIHLEIIDAEDIGLIGNGLLPVCDNDECEEIFYNLHLQDTIQFFLIEGYLSKNTHNYFDYGCVDSKVFKILKFTQIINSTDTIAN